MKTYASWSVRAVKRVGSGLRIKAKAGPSVYLRKRASLHIDSLLDYQNQTLTKMKRTPVQRKAVFAAPGCFWTIGESSRGLQRKLAALLLCRKMEVELLHSNELPVNGCALLKDGSACLMRGLSP